MALTVGYSGSAGIHLIHQEEDIDEVPPSLVHFDSALDSYVFPVPPGGARKSQRINPNFGSIRASDWNGNSNYHALQANLVQRPVKGLSYQIAYTYSKSIDNGSAVFQGVTKASTPPRRRGPSIPESTAASRILTCLTTSCSTPNTTCRHPGWRKTML